MAMGPGKYDDICATAYEQCGITGSGGTILIVMGGRHGNGFSCQTDLATLVELPDLLEHMAKQLRADAKKVMS